MPEPTSGRRVLTPAEIERRKPVWVAFSAFWLDTELDERDVQLIARKAAASGYSLAELHDIYLYEVAPVVYTNSLAAAGEWCGFDEQWLCAKARKRAEHRSALLRFWIAVRISRTIMTYAADPDWRRVVEILSDGSAAK